MKKVKGSDCQSFSTMLIAFVMLPLSGFATDIYIPSLPNMAAVLHIGTLQVQLTLSIFLITYGISQLLVGSLLDSFGRHSFCIGALIIFSITSVIIARSHDIYLIYGMRVIHGICIAFVIVAKRAFFVDVLRGEKLKKVLSAFTIIWSMGPIVAPFVGGYLQRSFGWRSDFYMLALYALLMAALEFIFCKETLVNVTTFSLTRIALIYTQMIRTIDFALGLMMLGLAGTTMMLYNLTAAFILEHQMGLSPVIAGYCSLIAGLAWMSGGIAGKMTLRQPFFKKLMVNVCLQVIFVLIMIACSHYIHVWYFMIAFVFLIHGCAGYTYSNYFTASMSRFPENAGIAGGLSGGFSYIVMSLLSSVIIYFIPAGGPRHLSFSYLITALVSLVVIYTLVTMTQKKRSGKTAELV